MGLKLITGIVYNKGLDRDRIRFKSFFIYNLCSYCLVLEKT